MLNFLVALKGRCLVQISPFLIYLSIQRVLTVFIIFIFFSEAFIMVVASFVTRCGLGSFILADNNCIKLTKTFHVESTGNEDKFTPVLTTMYETLKYLKVYMDENYDSVDEIIFETNVGTIVKWFDNGFPNVAYFKPFVKVMELLDEMPVRYSFRRSQKPAATVYLKKEYLEKPKISGFDFMEGIEDA